MEHMAISGTNSHFSDIISIFHMSNCSSFSYSNFIKLHKYYYLFVHHCALLDVFYGESSEITVLKELHELEGTASRILGSILSRF